MLGSIVLVPAVFAPIRRSVPSLGPKPVLVWAGGGALLAVAGLRLARERRLPAPATVALPLACVVAWAAVATAFSPHPWTALVGYPASRNGLLTVVAYAGAFMGAATALRTADLERVLRVLWFAAGGIVTAYGALQTADLALGGTGRWDPTSSLRQEFPNTIWSTFGNPDDLAGFLAVLLPIGIVLARLDLGRRRRASRAMVAVLVVELAVTSGRAAWLGAAAAVAVLAVSQRSRLTRGGAVRLGAVAVVVGGIAVGVMATGHAKYDLHRLTATGPGSTVDLRVQLWRAAGHAVGDHPLVGVGPDGFASSFLRYRPGTFAERYGVFSVATDPHDVVLTWFASTGVPGGIAFLMFLTAAALALARRLRDAPRQRERALRAAVSAGLLAWLVLGLASRQSTALDFVAWILLGAALAQDGNALDATTQLSPASASAYAVA